MLLSLKPGSWKAQREEEDDDDGTASTNRVMVFLYIWTVLLVIGLGILINRKFVQGNLNFVRWLLIGFANYALICAILIGGIPQLIIDQGEEIEETGWYGQPSVLIFMTCILEFLFSVIFGCRIGKHIQQQQLDFENGENPYEAFEGEQDGDSKQGFGEVASGALLKTKAGLLTAWSVTCTAAVAGSVLVSSWANKAFRGGKEEGNGDDVDGNYVDFQKNEDKDFLDTMFGWTLPSSSEEDQIGTVV